MLWINLSVAWRNLLRYRTFTFINIAGLSIGLASALVIAIFVRYELSFDSHHLASENIFKVVQDTRMGDEIYHWNTTAYPLAEALRHDFAQLKVVTQVSGPVNRLFRIQDAEGNVKRFEEPYVLFVDDSYPKLFNLTWIEGDPATALRHTHSIILTKTVAEKYFGLETTSKSLLGQQVFLNNKDALTVTGVVEDPPPNSSTHFSVLIPYEFFRINNPYFASNWSGNYQGTTFVALDQQTDPDDFETMLMPWKKKYLKAEDDNRITYRLLPLREVHTNEMYGYAPQSYTMPMRFIYTAIGIGIFMLLIAAINFINIATAHAAGRAREVGVRKVLGSSRFGLVKQFLHENILIVLFAVMLAVVIAQTFLGNINDMLTLIRMQLEVDIAAIALVTSTGIVVILLSCLYPAAVMSSYRPVEALKNKLQGGGNLSLRRVLVTFQFSIVQLFVIGTVVVASQLHFLKHQDLGFSKEDPIVIANLNDLERGEVLRQKLMAHPSVKDVTLSSSAPLSDYNHHYGTTFRLPGQREEDGKGAEEKGVDINYLSFFNLELIAGRNFSSVQPSFNEFIVNEKLVKELGLTPQQAIGQRLMINEGEANIVGVIRDFHNNSLQEELTPCVLLNSSQWLDRANIKVEKDADLAETVGFIEKSWKEVYPEGIFNSVFLDEALARNYTLEGLIFNGLTVFATLTILIGCLGLYGLLSYVTLRKTKEVGIRKTLGASVSQIVLMFGKEFIILIVISFFIAAPFSYYGASTWLDGFAYHVDISWWMFSVGIVITFVITCLTIGFQTLQAASANPVKALRND